MIWAVIRPESAQRVIKALDTAGIGGMTRLHVTGHGKEMGITLGAVHYTEIPKEMLMIVVSDNEVAKTVTIILKEAKTGSKNTPGELPLVTERSSSPTKRTHSRSVAPVRQLRPEKNEADHCHPAGRAG